MMIKKISVIVAAVFSAVLINSCHSKSEPTQTLSSLEPTLEIGNNLDSILFYEVKGIVSNENFHIIPCRDKVMVFDTDFHFLNEIENVGKGPKEFSEVLSVALQDSTLFLYDNVTRSMKKYKINGEFIGQRKITPSSSLLIDEEFEIFEDSIYIPTWEGILKMPQDLAGESVLVPIKFRKGLFSLYKTENQVLAMVLHSSPRILMLEKSSSTPKKVFDYSDLDIIKQTLIEVEKIYKERPNVVYTMVRDAYATQNSVYLLLGTKEENLEGRFAYRSNKILKISMLSWQIEGFYKLPDHAYSTISVSNKNQLIAYTRTAEYLQVFDLPSN